MTQEEQLVMYGYSLSRDSKDFSSEGNPIRGTGEIGDKVGGIRFGFHSDQPIKYDKGNIVSEAVEQSSPHVSTIDFASMVSTVAYLKASVLDAQTTLTLSMVERADKPSYDARVQLLSKCAAEYIPQLDNEIEDVVSGKRTLANWHAYAQTISSAINTTMESILNWTNISLLFSDTIDSASNVATSLANKAERAFDYGLPLLLIAAIIYLVLLVRR